MSVTIGDQKFIKDPNKGWIDAKTKQPADTGLIKLLDRVVIDEPEVKKLRIKIDRNVEPVSINEQKFVYDVNQGWIDEKTKIRAPDSLQRTLNMAGLGISGAAGLQSTKKTKPAAAKPGGGTPVKTRNIAINKPLIAMINQLASIDSYLKQQLQNKQIIATKIVAQAKETAIEAKVTNQISEEVTPDAKPEPNKLAAVGGAALLAALLVSQFDPVKNALKEISDFGVGVGNFVSNIAKTLNSGFDWLLGNKTKRDINDFGPDGAVDKGTKSATGAIAPSNVSTNESTSPINEVAESPAVNTPISNQSAQSPNVKAAPTAVAMPKVYSAPTTASPSTTSQPTSKPKPTARPVAVESKHGLKAKGGRTSGTGAPTAKEAERIQQSQKSKDAEPSNKSGGYINPVAGGASISSAYGMRSDPFTGKKKFHTGIDFKVAPGTPIRAVKAGKVTKTSSNQAPYTGFGNVVIIDHKDGNQSVYAHLSKFACRVGEEVKQGQIIGYSGGAKGAPGSGKSTGPHLHFIMQKTGIAVPNAGNTINPGGLKWSDGTTIPASSEGYAMEGDNTFIEQTTDTAVTAFETAKNLFSKAGAALIGAQNYEYRDINPVIKPSKLLSTVSNAVAVEKTASMADSRTPTPPPAAAKTTSAPNINPDKSSPVIQTPATTSDMSSINYYLERFGFAPAQSEMTIV